jgi:adenosylcobinamide-GDP ribazoletransferase
VAALLALVATVVLTGAFHEDGLADTFDARAGPCRANERWPS